MNAASADQKPVYKSDVRIDPVCKAVADRYLAASRALRDRSWLGLRMSAALRVFYWHLDAFNGDFDPRPQFIEVFTRAAELLESAARFHPGADPFPDSLPKGTDFDGFESRISGLFSDVWVGMTDDIYFDQSYNFTKERLERNGIDPDVLFKDKIVIDAGCGSGKFSAAIARFGAKQVIGLDIGEKGLEFARAQAKKVPYGGRLDYRYGSLLKIPLADASADMVWSNGVIHHTLGYETCLSEFARIIKKGGQLFLYVDGPSGLFELMCDTFVAAHADVPRELMQHYLVRLGINSGRVYWIMDCLFAPYERKTKEEVEALLYKHGFTDLKQLRRGMAIDNNEMVASGIPFAEIKYGNGMLKYLARKAG
jgi:ubiquinone/menaquinone biosynthesis C-methylase UbiE